MNKIELAKTIENLNAVQLAAHQLSPFVDEEGNAITIIVFDHVGLSVYDSSDYEELAENEFEVVIDYSDVIKEERDDFGDHFDLHVPAFFEIKSRNDEECQLVFVIKSNEK